MADSTSVFYQIGKSVTSAVNSRFTAFTQASNTYTGTQTYSTISLSGNLDAGTASATLKSLEILDLSSASGKVALVGTNGLITSGDLAYDTGTNTLSVANLNVTGTTTSVSTTNTEIADKVITLNKGGGATAGESGIVIEGGAANGAIAYNGSAWKVGTTTADGSGSIDVVTPGTLLVGGLQLNVVPEGGMFGTPQNLGNYNDFIAGLNA